MKPWPPIVLFLLLVACPRQVSAQQATSDAPAVSWIRNEHLKVGLDRLSGGALCWISHADSNDNLINNHDRGRLIQQSWYGAEDGTFWDQRPWNWNPVQGGDWRGKSSEILEEKYTESHATVKTRPRHWARGDLLKDCTMQQSVNLDGPLVHIHYDFHYTGSQSHPPRHQELPAVFMNSQYRTLVFCEHQDVWNGGPLRRIQPGWPNEYHAITEDWAAYVNDKDFGLGCYSPGSKQLTCYRFQPDRPDPSACCYFAPIRTLAISSPFHFEYDVWITAGSVEQIRQRFADVARSRASR